MSQGNDPAAAAGVGEEPSRLPRAKKLATRQAAATSTGMFLRRLYKGRHVTSVFDGFTSLLLSDRYFYLLTIEEFALSSVTIDVFDSDYVHVALRMLMRKPGQVALSSHTVRRKAKLSLDRRVFVRSVKAF
jgi:hypothetical protein